MKASSADYSQYCKLILAHYLMVNIIDLVRMLMVECMEVQSGLWQRGLQLLVLEQSLRKTRTSSLENSAFLISLLLHIMYISLYFLSQLLHFNIFKILIFMTHTFHLTHSKRVEPSTSILSGQQALGVLQWRRSLDVRFTMNNAFRYGSLDTRFSKVLPLKSRFRVTELLFLPCC